MLTRKLYIAILSLFICASAFAQRAPELNRYHSVSAKKGDGIYTLLRRYHLDVEQCNLKQFYALNNLKPNATIQIGKKYKIPVLIYSYNGKSIRTTLGIDDLQKALRIKSYNEKILKASLRRTNFIESRILWVPHHELFCGQETKLEEEAISTSKEKPQETTELKRPEAEAAIETPVKNGTIKNLYMPLFGKGKENVAILDHQLKDHVYYVVSGHGGPDPGARCTDCDNTLCEDEYAYDVALRLARNLLQHGATVHMIIQDTDGIRDGSFLKCDGDEKCLGKLKIPRNQKLRLMQRSTAINDLYKLYKKKGVKNQQTISIHIDSNKKSMKMDSYFCYYKHSSRSKKMASDLQKTFKKKYKKYQKSRPYKGRITPKGFYILRNTLPPAVLVELANIKNAKNQKRFTKSSNRQLLADWMAEGLTGIPN